MENRDFQTLIFEAIQLSSGFKSTTTTYFTARHNRFKNKFQAFLRHTKIENWEEAGDSTHNINVNRDTSVMVLINL